MSSTEAPTTQHLTHAFLICCGAGLATSIGAGIVLWANIVNRRFLAVGLSLSAGVMIYVALVEILYKSVDSYTEHFNILFPNEENEGLNEARGYALATGVFFIGVLFTMFLDVIVHQLYALVGSKTHDHLLPLEGQLASDNNDVSTASNVERTGRHDVDDVKSKDVENGVDSDGASQKEHLMKTALITGVAIAIHNLPEGLATFVELSNSLGSGIPLAFAIAIHNVPEGMAVALPVYYQTNSKIKAFIWGTLSGLTEPIGGAIGWAIIANAGETSEPVYGSLFAVVAGMMAYISLKEMIPTAYMYDKSVVATSVFGGMFIMAASLVLFQFWLAGL